MISIWLLQFEIWIIIGIIFILLELTDGSAIFFLPLGIGSLILSLYIYLCNIELISESLSLETWYFALVVWAILSLITSILISLARKKYSNEVDHTGCRRKADMTAVLESGIARGSVLVLQHSRSTTSICH